ncbi:hypothetical protein NBO_462g0005 [Nosema bombycis CQ1]|uniref:Uncharacterized protein n=1 Tax=Nosema bombycis (strain CQ1 / CVCC 102059) TaxID=578461 RepID=R0KNS8_NOSB1|nr:hypothetical protein NBO_462g0005 [Nosema bombycis CQ1]|eukprot:EOB12336.1 hypothetical protein NBO_462g0005 [Nosema bombycis CQ1]
MTQANFRPFGTRFKVFGIRKHKIYNFILKKLCCVCLILCKIFYLNIIYIF